MGVALKASSCTEYRSTLSSPNKVKVPVASKLSEDKESFKTEGDWVRVE